MTLPQFRNYVEGYQDHLFDLKCLAAIAGYWAGYYGNTKRPKPLGTVLKELMKGHMQSKKQRRHNTNVSKPEVDVDEFHRREEQFNKRLNRR